MLQRCVKSVHWSQRHIASQITMSKLLDFSTISQEMHWESSRISGIRNVWHNALIFHVSSVVITFAARINLHASDDRRDDVPFGDLYISHTAFLRRFLVRSAQVQRVVASYTDRIQLRQGTTLLHLPSPDLLVNSPTADRAHQT